MKFFVILWHETDINYSLYNVLFAWASTRN